LYFAILAVDAVNNLPGVTLACNKVMKKNTINTFNIFGIDFALKKSEFRIFGKHDQPSAHKRK